MKELAWNEGYKKLKDFGFPLFLTKSFIKDNFIFNLATFFNGELIKHEKLRDNQDLHWSSKWWIHTLIVRTCVINYLGCERPGGTQV